MHCPPNTFIPITPDDSATRVRGTKMPSPQMDFPVISRESAIDALKKHVNACFSCRRSVMKKLCVKRVALSDLRHD